MTGAIRGSTAHPPSGTCSPTRYNCGIRRSDPAPTFYLEDGDPGKPSPPNAPTPYGRYKTLLPTRLLPPGAWVQTQTAVLVLVSTPTGTCVTTWYTPNPSGRLTEGNAHNTPQSQLGGHAQVHVWAALNLAHSQLEREWRDRHEDKKPPPVTWCGGRVVDWQFFTTPTSACRGAVNLGDWEWQMHATDRARPPVAVASADVHHIYWQQLSTYSHPCAPDLNAVPHNDVREHTTWVDLLSHNGTPGLGEANMKWSG